MARLIAFWKQGAYRNCNLNYQKVRIAFAHLKARADVRVYMRTPMGRYLTRERGQDRGMRESFGIARVRFAGALSTDIHVLMPLPNSGDANPFTPDAYRDEPGHVSHFSRDPGWHVTEHDYTPDPHVIWQTPIRTIFAVEQLMDLPLIVKRIPIDEVDSKMDYAEHRYVQHYGGGFDTRWRVALSLVEGVEDVADRAIWNQPEHPQLQLALNDVPELLIERDIKHAISESTIPDEYHPEESELVSHVRKLRKEGSDGIRRMQGLLEEDEMELLIEYIHVTTGRQHPGWLSDSLFRMWRERHGFWHTVTYMGLFPPGLGKKGAPQGPTSCAPGAPLIGQYCLLWG